MGRGADGQKISSAFTDIVGSSVHQRQTRTSKGSQPGQAHAYGELNALLQCNAHADSTPAHVSACAIGSGQSV
jgi:hypothetical protein